VRPGLTVFNLAVPGHPMGLSERITQAQRRGLLGKRSTPDRRGRSEPPEQAQVLQPGAGLFHPKNPERLSFFSRILTTRHAPPDIEGAVATARLGKLATPAQYGRAEPPNLLLQFVGSPWIIYTGKAYQRCTNQPLRAKPYDT